MRILVVEDEPAVRDHLAGALEHAGYAVDAAGDGTRADFLVRTERYDVVLLDLGLPNVDGISLLAQWRADGLPVPVMVLTARGSWSDRVHGIDTGADDYLAKPFRLEEVLARVRALIRRASGHARADLRSGLITLDPRASRVTLEGRPIDVTAHEYRLLSYLMHQAGRVVSRAELIDHLYAHGSDRDSNTLEVFVGRLRRKLGASAIETVRGLGYRVPGTPVDASRT